MKLKLIITKEQGFSLLEVLIGVTLLALLMIGVYTIIDNNTRSRDKILFEDRRVVEVEMALSRIDSDFSQIFTPAYFSGRKVKSDLSNDSYDAQAQNEDDFSPSEFFPYQTENGTAAIKFQMPEKGSFVLFTFGNKRKVEDSHESIFQWVKYSFTDRIPDGVNISRHSSAPYILERRSISENIYSSQLDFSTVRPQILLKNIKNFEVSFYDKNKNKYVSSIEELGDEQHRPRGIKILINWLDSNNFEQKSERIYRVFWTAFDAEAELKEIKKIEFENKAISNSQGAGNNPGSDPGDTPGSN